MNTLRLLHYASETDSAQASPAPESGVPALRRLFWVYFILLVFEGALRKWVVPQLSGPLLLARDPVALLIYFFALQHGSKIQSRSFAFLMALTIGGLLLFFVQMLTLDVPAGVLVYGLRSNFLHLPLIFVAPMAFSKEDLLKLGRWVLILSIPLSLLMTAQFEASPTAWINRIPGTAEGMQLPSALGRIRPPATFSFITGVVSYYSLAVAFLLAGLKRSQSKYPTWLLFGSSAAILLALVVSGSRAFVLSAAIVLAVWLLGIMATKRSQAQITRLLLLLALAFAFLNQVEVFHEGTRVLSARWQAASESEDPEGGLPSRILRSLLSPFHALTDTPMTGIGFGVGTNVGARLLTGRRQFLLSEEEWARLVMEMGPLLGMAFIAWRVSFSLWLARASIRCATGGFALPLLLFGSCASHLLTGQLHQSTTQGFTALLTGLCYAAIKTTAPSEEIINRRSFRRYRPPKTNAPVEATGA